MASVGIGDMSQSFAMSRNMNSVKSRLYSLNNELNSGRIGDISKRLGGQNAILDSLDRDIQLLDQFEQSNKLLASSLERLQLSFDSVNDMRNSMIEQFLPITPASLNTEFDLASKRARSDMSTIISKLNQNDAGRSVLSGIATDTDPFASAEDMLADIAILVGATTDAATITTIVTDWFEAPGGGFDSMGYLGDTSTVLQQRRIGAHETLTLNARGDDPAIRSLLKGVALAAIADVLPTTLSNDDKADLMRTSAEALLSAGSELVSMQAGIGENEERISLAQASQTAQKTTLSIARNDLVLADPYETATKLQDVQRQLEMQFTSTARLSQLSLVNFI